jgi:MFS transporter, FSR family, fosmidomycin resistance protein
MAIFSRTFVSLLILHALLDCFAGIWPIYKHIAQIPLGTAGFIVTSATLIAFVLQPLCGLWADHGYSRVCVVIGTLMTFPMMLLGPLSLELDNLSPVMGYFLLFVIVFSAKIGQALYHPAGATIAGNETTTRRSTYLSIFVAFGWIGYGSSQILFSYSYRWTHSHTEWLLLPGGAILLLAALGCRPAELNVTGAERPSLIRSLTQIPFTQQRLYVLFFLLAAMSAMAQGMLFLLPEIIESKGFPEWYINGGALVWYVIGAATAMIPAGYVADKLGKKAVLSGSIIGSIIVFYIFVLLPNMSISILIILMISLGSSMNIANPIGIALGQQMFPEKSSLISGVLMGLAWALGATSPWAIGVMTSQLDFTPTQALCVLGTTGIFSLICSAFIASSDFCKT